MLGRVNTIATLIKLIFGFSSMTMTYAAEEFNNFLEYMQLNIIDMFSNCFVFE